MSILTKQQCRAARGGLAWTREYLYKKSSVAVRTIIDFESGARNPISATRSQLRAAFEDAGVKFNDNNIVIPIENK